jgi:hypothetical protein
MSDKQHRHSTEEQSQQTGTEQLSEPLYSSLGENYTIARGDTLSGIAVRAYGAARHWRHIMAANPDKVHRGGDLIVVGDELSMPPVGAMLTPVTEPEAVAIQLEEVRTPYGNFLVVPEEYPGEPDPRTGWTIVHAAQFEAVKNARIEQAEQDGEAALASAQELLSYSSLDWVITDANAIDAMSMVAALPVPQRQSVLRQMGPEMTARLLDNLPESSQQTVEYAKLLVGFGIEYVRDRLQKLDSLFLSGRGEEILEGLADAHIDVLIAALPDGNGLLEWQEAMLYSIFQMVPDANVARLEMLFEKRFAMDLKAYVPEPTEDEVGAAWDAPQIRRLWSVLMYLPESHVEGNDHIDTMERYLDPGGSTGGWFWPKGGDQEQIAMGFETSQINDTIDWSEEGDAIQGDVYFDQALRHEVGHAVDDRDGIMSSSMGDAICGNWQPHSSMAVIADIWLNDSDGSLGGLVGDEREAVRSILIACMVAENLDDFVSTIAALPFWEDRGLDGDMEAMFDPVYYQLEYALSEPWYSADQSGPDVDGRIYQKSYDEDWHSYKVSAKRYRISSYQWRAPGEWFAEVYATYYDPRQERGSLLPAQIRTWFESKVGAPTGPPTGDSPA